MSPLETVWFTQVAKFFEEAFREIRFRGQRCPHPPAGDYFATLTIGEITDGSIFLPVIYGEKCPAGQ
ncbi:hypothetical protein X736_19350 [Mesorhizobium sp. L2C089B000]|nr:hypothetical protein X736_19350 [Mesorhizobium sp. L2C089B000]